SFLHPLTRPPPPSTLFPYTTLFRSDVLLHRELRQHVERLEDEAVAVAPKARERIVVHARELVFVEVDRALVDRLEPRDEVEQCRSEEHTSELQSPYDLVCRLLLEKK